MQNEFLDDHFSRNLSPEIIDYVSEVVFKTSRYIFFRRLGRSQYGFCTHCKHEFKTEGLRHNAETICPECLSGCIVKADGMGRTLMIDKAYFVYYEKSIIDPNVIIARGIYSVRDYRSDYENVITKYQEIAQYVFSSGWGGVMRSRYIYYKHDGSFYVGDWKRAYNLHSLFNKDHIGHIPRFVSHESIAAATKNTSFQYSAWECYVSRHYKDLTEFFNLYAKYSCLEYLTKLGFKGLVQAKLDKQATYGAINWRGKSLEKVLKLSKQEIHEIKQWKLHVDFYFLKLLQTSKKHKYGFTIPEIIKICRGWTFYEFKELQNLANYSSIKLIFSYIFRQVNSDHNAEKHFYSTSGVISTYKDYISDCIKLGLDLYQEVILFPKDLYLAHQESNKRVKVKNDPETNRKIINRAKRLQRFNFEYKGLFIRPVESFEEMIDEGNILEHCVAKHYAEDYANGKTDILLIRKLSEPDKPYFTVQLYQNRIIQVRGFKNSNPDDQVKVFLDTFDSKKLKKQAKKQVLKTA